MNKAKLNALLIVLSISLVSFYNIIDLESFEKFSLDSKNKNQEFDNNKAPNTSQSYQSPVIYEDTFGFAHDVYVSGNYAYVADGPNGLMIIDISDPINPILNATKDTTGDARDVYVSGNYAYIADANSGLAIIDITDPTNPGDPIYKSSNGLAREIHIDGDYAYIANDFGNGLTVMDISNISDIGDPIKEVTSGYASGVYVDGNFAYLADAWSGLAILNITNPLNPQFITYVSNLDFAETVFISGNYAFVAGGMNGRLTIIDITDPTNPGIPINKSSAGQASDVFVSGDYAYVANKESGLTIFDIKDPTAPGDPIYMDTLGNATGIYVDGNYAYIADGEAGLAIIKISEISITGERYNKDTTGYSRNIFISGNYAFVADRSSGLAVIDITDPTNLGNPIYGPTTGSAEDVFVSGNYAYIADWYDGLCVYDVSNPLNPINPVYIDTSYVAYSVFVSGNYVYVANADSGLAIINISDPTNPTDLNYINPLGGVKDVFISGNFAYVAVGEEGLCVINITAPTNPNILAYRNLSRDARTIFVDGNYAYMSCNDPGSLAIIDISDPLNPGEPVFLPIGGIGIFVSGNYAFYACADSGGLKVIDVSNPESPFLFNMTYTNYAMGVHVSGEYAYVADGSSGLTVVQIRHLYSFKPFVISDLGNYSIGSSSVELSWEAPYIDDGLNNSVSSYIVKYSTDPINDGNFDLATNFDTSNWSTLAGYGDIEYRNVTGLNPNTMYYFAIKSVDINGVYSEISNVFNITTLKTTIGDFFGNLSLLEKILYGSGALLVISAIITIPVVRSKKKKKQRKEVGIVQEPTDLKTEAKIESKAEEKAKAKAEKSRLSEEKIQKKRGDVENDLKSVSALIQEGLYTQVILSLKILEKTVNKNKFLREFKPEIEKKLKFCENTTHFRTEKEKFEKIYKSDENFIDVYNGMNKLNVDINKFPVDSELIHPAVVLEVSEAFQVLKEEYEERKANLLSRISSISDLSKPEEILDLESKFLSLEKEANALKMDYVLPKINDQRNKYEKNLEIYKEKEDLQLVFNQGDISKANFGIAKLNDSIEEISKESGENYIYSAIVLDISEFSKLVQADINERNASLYELNEHYETMFRPDQIRNVKELFGNILNDAEALGIKDLTKKIKHNLNICGVSIPFVEEKEKYLQLYSGGQLENAYVGLESLKNRIEVHPRQDLVAPNIKSDIENTYDDIYSEVKNINAKIFGEIESIESLMNSEQISDAKTRLIQLQNESSQLGFKEVNNKINRMIQVCNISLPILDDKNKYWTQYADQNQLIPALDGLQNLVADIDKGVQSDLILPSIVNDLREKLEFLKNKLDENRKEIEDKLKQIFQTIDPDHLSEVIEMMKTQREIAQKLRFDDIDKKIAENLIDFEDVSKIYELFKRAKRLAITDISRKSDISREKLIDMMLDPEKGLEMLEIDGDFITVKQLLTQPKQGIAAVPTTEIKETPYKAESAEISQNQELQILREFEYISGQVRFKVGVINQSPGVLTNIKIDFTIPDALKWITYEPISYKRKGDSVMIPKLSLNEKKSINLYLEPISCMSGPINAIVSYFNALDEPRAITMRPKVIGITCPIFFTEEEANLARVESLYRQLSHKDKKILPIQKDQDLQKIFNLLLKVGGSHQIKLVSKEFSAENKVGKVLYYGLTKVKKQKMVIIFLLNGGEQTIEVEIAGDSEEAITALLAEIENQIRVIFTKERVIKSSDKFHEMKTSVVLGYCPFCGANFDSAQQEGFIKGNSITCEYCDKVINFN